jgi:hypothetical protein
MPSAQMSGAVAPASLDAQSMAAASALLMNLDRYDR